MRYREITFFAESAGALSELTEKLTEIGYDNMLINDPADVDELIEGSWAYTGSVADRELLDGMRSKAYAVIYLGEDEAPSGQLAELMRGCECSQAVVDDEDWLHKWEEYYVPFHITSDIVVKPVWREYDKQPGELVIDIDPGLAFGTGSSPTTYLAARLVEKYIRPGYAVIDAGCGTGILSVIASRLGASEVLALDIDSEAVAATENNAAKNGCEGIIAREGDLLKGVDFKADMVIANLLAPLVMELSGQAARGADGSGGCCGKGALLIASGIIDDMEEACMQAVEANGFKIFDIMREDCWTAFAAEYAGRP